MQFHVGATCIAVLAASQIIPAASWVASANHAGIASAGKHRFDQNTVRLLAAVTEAKRANDVVIVIMHWGIEGDPCPSPIQMQLGTQLAKAGATAVLGAHPHVLQPVVTLLGESRTQSRHCLLIGQLHLGSEVGGDCRYGHPRTPLRRCGPRWVHLHPASTRWQRLGSTRRPDLGRKPDRRARRPQLRCRQGPIEWHVHINTGHLDTGHLDTGHLNTSHLDTSHLNPSKHNTNINNSCIERNTDDSDDRHAAVVSSAAPTSTTTLTGTPTSSTTPARVVVTNYTNSGPTIVDMELKGFDDKRSPIVNHRRRGGGADRCAVDSQAHHRHAVSAGEDRHRDRDGSRDRRRIHPLVKQTQPRKSSSRVRFAPGSPRLAPRAPNR